MKVLTRLPAWRRLRVRVGAAARSAYAMVLALILLLGVVVPALAAGPSIVGDGSSFAEQELQQWISDTGRQQGLQVTYSYGDDAQGRSDFAQDHVDLAGTDIPYQTSDSATPKKPYEYVNVSAGGLGFMYHLTDTQGNQVTNLNLTPTQVCKIFVNPRSDLAPPSPWGTLYWDAPDIQANNPNVSLPHQAIQAAVRRDPGAGTSYLLMQFCIADAPQIWATAINWWHQWYDHAVILAPGSVEPDFVDGQPHADWPDCACADQGNSADEIANYVASPLTGQGTITYVSNGFAVNRGFPVASIQNSTGAFTQPTAHNVNEGLAYATTSPVGTLNLAFSAPRADTYFPSTYTYILAPTGGTDPAKGAVLAKFLNYAVTQGQTEATILGFAPLACGIVGSALDDIAKIPGAPAEPANPCSVPNPTTGPNGGPNPTTGPNGGPATSAGPNGGPATSTGPNGSAAPTTRQPGSVGSGVARGGSATPTGVAAGPLNPGQATCPATSTATVTGRGTLACGAAATFTIDVASPASARTITNTATIAGKEADANPANNTASATTTVGPPGGVAPVTTPSPAGNTPSATTTVGASADLVVSTIAPVTATTSSPISFTIVATNNGPGPATGVVVTDTLPAGVTFVSASAGCAFAPGTVTCVPGEAASNLSAVVLSAGRPIPPSGAAGLRTLLEGAGACALVLGLVLGLVPATRRARRKLR